MNLITRLFVSAGVVLLYRWTLHLSTPKADYRLACDYGYKAAIAARRGLAMLRVWLVSQIRYLPNKQVEAAWVALRDRLAQGRYGTSGT